MYLFSELVNIAFEPFCDNQCLYQTRHFLTGVEASVQTF
jgi:hypothetical protein